MTYLQVLFQISLCIIFPKLLVNNGTSFMLDIVMTIILFVLSRPLTSFIHEFGHFLACRYYNHPVKEIIIGHLDSKELFIFKFFNTKLSFRRNILHGGMIYWEFNSNGINLGQRAIISAAGPIAALILLIFEIGLTYYLDSFNLINMFFPLLFSFHSFGANLIPLKGNDGEKIYSWIKSLFKGKNQKTQG